MAARWNGVRHRRDRLDEHRGGERLGPNWASQASTWGPSLPITARLRSAASGNTHNGMLTGAGCTVTELLGVQQWEHRHQHRATPARSRTARRTTTAPTGHYRLRQHGLKLLGVP